MRSAYGAVFSVEISGCVTIEMLESDWLKSLVDQCHRIERIVVRIKLRGCSAVKLKVVSLKNTISIGRKKRW
jgi:hypothetical protein